jgi:hypothetical protein
MHNRDAFWGAMGVPDVAKGIPFVARPVRALILEIGSFFEKPDPVICGDQFSGKGEWQASFGQVKGCDMIRATFLKLKAWLSPEAASSGAKAKGHSSVASAQLAESAKKTKRRAQRQARARNR